MCGIAGIVPSNPTIDYDRLEQLHTLFLAIEDRGGHACGIAHKNIDWGICVEKGPYNPSKISFARFCEMVTLDIDWVLMHTRYTTQGSIHNNENNHPIDNHNHIVTHNGVLWNDDNVFDYWGNDIRCAEVDSEAINAALNYGGVEWLTEFVQGSYSLAWVDRSNSTVVNLLTNGRNPLVIGRLSDNSVVWASNLYHLTDAFGEDLVQSFNATPFKLYTICSTDMVIRSEFRTEKRANPTVLGRRSHVASYGSAAPKKKKSKKTPSKQRKQVTKIEAGFAFDEKKKVWRRATLDDYPDFADLFRGE
jgi:glutamine phosphoribosylpyrophosphate amidotransferase